MKLTKEQYSHLKSKKAFQSEGIVKRLFAKFLVNKIKKNSDIMKAIDDADKATENLKDAIVNAEKRGLVIPDELKKYAGLSK